MNNFAKTKNYCSVVDLKGIFLSTPPNIFLHLQKFLQL